MNELKYCKFCDKEKPIKDFAKSGFAIKNICRECQNKKQTQIYKNSKEVEKLEQENKILKENAEHNDKVVDKVNWENMLLKKENKRLKDNWNKLREWIVYNKHNENTEQHYLVVDYGTLLGKMQELEGSDSNE